MSIVSISELTGASLPLDTGADLEVELDGESLKVKADQLPYPVMTQYPISPNNTIDPEAFLVTNEQGLFRRMRLNAIPFPARENRVQNFEELGTELGTGRAVRTGNVVTVDWTDIVTNNPTSGEFIFTLGQRFRPRTNVLNIYEVAGISGGMTRFFRVQVNTAGQVGLSLTDSDGGAPDITNFPRGCITFPANLTTQQYSLN